MNDQTHSAETAHDFQQLRADFTKLSESVSELVKAQAKAASASIADSMSQSSDQLSAKLTDLGQSARQASDSAQIGMRSAAHDIEGSINRNPLGAVLVAAGVGLLFGILSARS